MQGQSNGTRMSAGRVIAWGALAIIGSATASYGEIITFGYSGTITGANYDYGTPPADPIEVGEAFSGWFEVDTETPDNATGSEFYGEYQRFGRVAFNVDDIVGISGKTPWMRIDAGDYDNRIELSDQSGWDYGSYQFGEFFMRFDAPEGQTVLADDRLPTAPSDFDGLTDRWVFMIINPVDYSYGLVLGGRIESLYLIPEPGSFLLMGIAGAWGLRWRNSNA